MIPVIIVTVVFVVYFQTRYITDDKCYTVTNDTDHHCYCRVRCLFSDKIYNDVKCYTITNDTNHHCYSRVRCLFSDKTYNGC